MPTFVLDTRCQVVIWNKACERLTGIPAAEVIQTSDHWRGFYDTPRPCLADLVAQGRFQDISSLYASWASFGVSDFGVSAENWCVMPKLGRRLYLAIDAGPIYDESGDLIAVVETLRDITAQREAQTALETLAARDGLTGLANRRCFDETLDAELRRAAREKLPLCLLMIDVDHFKAYNDSYGHRQGDECLKEVARTIAGVLRRPGDVAARYGGEEFAAILPNTTLEGATLIAERVRMTVEHLGIPHRASPTAAHVTISIGGAVAAPLEPGGDRLLESADSALYASKRNGRNQSLIVASRSSAVRRHVRRA